MQAVALGARDQPLSEHGVGSAIYCGPAQNGRREWAHVHIALALRVSDPDG